ncbi:MAG: hypothetical protein ACLGIT_11385 [Gammaproteobacteria bacterium]
MHDQPKPPADTPDLGRRRFTRAGTAVPVVLGALSSKPVLGASLTHCTVSGQVSGNLSRQGLAEDCVVGLSRGDWLSASAWPSPFVKGTQPQATNCSFTGGGWLRGTNFNGYTPGGGVPALTATFYNRTVGSPPVCTMGTTTSSNPATMLQVLASADPSDTALTDLYRLARAVVTSLLNAQEAFNSGLSYPVTAHTIIAMYNATCTGGSYGVTASKSWSRSRVIEYLESLYPLS